VPDGEGPALDRHWAGWRSDYINSAFAGDAGVAGSAPEGEGSLFERILHSGDPDEVTYVLHRGPHTFAILNAYPYNSGHLMVLPNRAVADLEALTADESTALWGMVTQAVTAIKAAYQPQGVNVGINLGHAAGAGVPDHLHVHCLPRWFGDTNFVTTIAETRVLPEPLTVTWERLRAAWPS
jgi:ATP adenylyltransferase